MPYFFMNIALFYYYLPGSLKLSILESVSAFCLVWLFLIHIVSWEPQISVCSFSSSIFCMTHSDPDVTCYLYFSWFPPPPSLTSLPFSPCFGEGDLQL